jgi:4'-phosphopantetheinyl transferase
MADGWEVVPSMPVLNPGEIQIWLIGLSEVMVLDETCMRHLSAEELERAERLRAGQTRMQFLVARSCLRVLLGNILNLDPKSVPITLNAYGKPQTPAADGDPLHFNVAHSRETILIAVCRASAVGIDLEYLDRKTEVLAVARDFFHPDEFQEIAAIEDPELRRQGFFSCWTRKEAIVKADGRGLSLPLTAFKVPVLGSVAAFRVTVSDEIEDARACRIETGGPAEYLISDLALGDGIAAAFAVTADLFPRKIIFPLAAL